MKRVLFSFFLIVVCPAAGLAAEADYPPPPQPGQTISVDDTIYGVLRTHRNLRGMLENRDVLEHEVDRARAGFGPRVDVSGRAGYGVISDSSSRFLDNDSQMWSVVGYSATLVQPIWDGFAARSRVRSAKSTLESVK
ncbi:MAG: TolC family protein, partial [Desulfovibrio sp.]|nr:TolC family protein [Desulfovibrio sp.]